MQHFPLRSKKKFLGMEHSPLPRQHPTLLWHLIIDCRPQHDIPDPPLGAAEYV